MTLARIRSGRLAGQELELVDFTDRAEFVLRSSEGGVTLFEESSPLERVEIRCDVCGRWSTDAAPHPDLPHVWRCYGGLGPCPQEAEPTG